MLPAPCPFPFPFPSPAIPPVQMKRLGWALAGAVRRIPEGSGACRDEMRVGCPPTIEEVAFPNFVYLLGPCPRPHPGTRRFRSHTIPALPSMSSHVAAGRGGIGSRCAWPRAPPLVPHSPRRRTRKLRFPCPCTCVDEQHETEVRNVSHLGGVRSGRVLVARIWDSKLPTRSGTLLPGRGTR